MAEHANENNIYQPIFEEIEKIEGEYVDSRREKAAAEFSNLYKDEKNAWYAELLKKPQKERPSIGLALSGGGIRSATFNLGILQGLSKFGILPWVDYLSSVSGGGYISACMTSLLSYEEKRIKPGDAWKEERELDDRQDYEDEQDLEYGQVLSKGQSKNEQKVEDEQELEESREKRYYPFNTFWERFPFNPNLQVFDVGGVAYDLESMEKRGKKNKEFIEAFKRGEATFEEVRGDLPLKKINNKKPNRQLEHLRNSGNFLIPRMGLLTVDMIRGLGALFLRIAYTLSIFITAMIMLSAIHFSIAVAFTPKILISFPIKDYSHIAPLLFGAFSYKTEVNYPLATYGIVFAGGMIFSTIMAGLVSLNYRKDPTTENRYRCLNSPSDKVSTYTWLVISGITILAFILVTLLAWFTAKLWLMDHADLAKNQPYFYFTMLGLYICYLLAGIIFIIHSRDEKWAEQGLPEQEWIDKLSVKLVVLIMLWVMTLLLTFLKVKEGFDNKWHIYWIWMPAVFLFGGGWGLILSQYCSNFLSKWSLKKVKPPKNLIYNEESVPSAIRRYLKFMYKLRNKKIKEEKGREESFSRGFTPYPFVIWSNPDFRSIFWTMQGLLMYGTLGFILFGAILIPHYFSSVQTEQNRVIIPLSTALLSALWSSYLASNSNKDKKSPFTWLTKIFSLPPELKQTLLSLLVFALNLSVLLLIEIVLKIMPSWLGEWQFLSIFGAASILVFLQGWINANYLTLHYFYRDRIADAYLRTEVDDMGISDETGHAQKPRVGIPRDDRDKLMSHILWAHCSAPYHIVQTAINLGGSWFLQFKDRKSQHFIFTKEYSGSNLTGYVKTDSYRGNSTKYSQAIALSGAAVSSGLGYITTFAYAFVITLFNLRLGLWFVNPKQYETDNDIEKKKRKKRTEQSKFWLSYLWDEMRGRMNERGEMVNITDGAHTEDNIGMYPLFQRRCKYIIACDAGEDPEGKCENLMAVIRQANIDLGIEVDINVESLKPEKYDKEKKEVSESKAHFAIGRIRYPRDPKSGEKAWNGNNQKNRGKQNKDEEYDNGWLIYFRPCIVKDEPAPVLKYWQKHIMDFPHPSTADQFFDEEQFEVHRILGEWTIASALKEISSKFAASKTHVQYGDFLGNFIKPDSDDIPESFYLKDEKEKKKPKHKKTVKPIKFDSLFEEYHKLSSHSKPG